MKRAKIALVVVGGLACLIGLVWIGQGTGYFPYPARSFMISQTVWADRGAGLLLAGLAAIVLARRLRRPT
ncbi:MAG: hypothetical protein EXQ85_03645 [Alphaproteobacteria bacterium]|nr:hypothetical protein [Alphaproteobacteria bacterium]